mmetsp:Transcript_10860/g.32135  ORF Transcript_10860/g.32135 Transcript_10860/m.32135 type:complete len:237 (-) Transcript_10860:137-847(-)
MKTETKIPVVGRTTDSRRRRASPLRQPSTSSSSSPGVDDRARAPRGVGWTAPRRRTPIRSTNGIPYFLFTGSQLRVAQPDAQPSPSPNAATFLFLRSAFFSASSFVMRPICTRHFSLSSLRLVSTSKSLSLSLPESSRKEPSVRFGIQEVRVYTYVCAGNVCPVPLCDLFTTLSSYYAHYYDSLFLLFDSLLVLTNYDPSPLSVTIVTVRSLAKRKPFSSFVVCPTTTLLACLLAI